MNTVSKIGATAAIVGSLAACGPTTKSLVEGPTAAPTRVEIIVSSIRSSGKLKCSKTLGIYMQEGDKELRRPDSKDCSPTNLYNIATANEFNTIAMMVHPSASGDPKSKID